jgi:hypothetical protein
VREFVGVTGLLDVIVATHYKPAFLKQQALMFSRIALPAHTLCMTEIRKKDKQLPDYLAEVEWLIEQGIAFEPDYVFRKPELMSDAEYRAYYERAEEQYARVDELTRGLRRNSKKYKEVFIGHGVLAAQCHTRLASIQLREVNGMDAHSVFQLPFEPLGAFRESKGEVVKLTLHTLPEPDESTPWEQIMEYRSDADSQGKFLALRNWMTDVAKANLPPAEVEEKLEWLAYEYQKHLNLHRLKTKAGVLETIITTSAEVLGDLASFKWGKAAEALFSLKRGRVELLEGELTAPGNEVAYIVKAREKFNYE